MRSFKNYTTFIKFAWSLSALSFLVGCNLPSPKDKHGKEGANQVATFTAQTMADASKVMETSVQGSFALPNSKIFNLQACVKDAAYNRPILGHDFIIEEFNKTVTSDKSGCITWPENIEFNFLGESQYVLIERHILGKGLHKGSQTVSFAINPWADGSSVPSVLNPENNKIEKLVEDKKQGLLALKGLSSDDQKIARPLWLEEGRLFISEQKLTSGGIDLQLDLKASPSILLTKMNGETFPRPLTHGNFKGRLKLIHTYLENNQEIRRLLNETTFLDSTTRNGILTFKSTLTLPVIPTRGQVMLGLELQAVDGPLGLKNFEGVYLLGEYDQIKSSPFLKLDSSLRKNNDFKIANYINAYSDEVTKKLQTGGEVDVYQKPKIEVSQLEFPNMRVGLETTSTREIIFNIKACLRHGLDSKTTRSHTFKITRLRTSEQEPAQSVSIKSDSITSCLSWDERFTFKYFDCQHYVKTFFQIENSDLGMKEKFEIILNPWEKGGPVARDMRFVDPNQKLPLTCQSESRPNTQIYLDGFSYSTLSYNYSVDSFLNLTVTKKIQLQLRPRLLMYSSLTGGRGETQNLRDGIYLLRTAIVQNQDYDTNNTYVTSADKIVNVIDGQINTELTFQTQDLKALGNRNNILIEIYAVDESKVDFFEGKIKPKNPNALMESSIDLTTGLSSPTFIGPITLNIDESSRPLRMIDASAISQIFLNSQTSGLENEKFLIQKVVNQGLKSLTETRQRIQQRFEKTQLAKENNLDLISLKNSQESAILAKSFTGDTKVNESNIINRSDLLELVSSGKLNSQTAHKLCAFWGADYFRKMNTDKGGAAIKQTSFGFAKDCMKAVQKDPSTFFNVENQMRINEVGDLKFLKGLSQSYTVGTSFSVSKSHSVTKSDTWSAGGKVGASGEFKFIELDLGGGFTLSRSDSNSNTNNNAIAVASSTTLNMQQNIFRIRVNKYERCTTVRLNPSLFVKESKWFGLLSRRNYLDILNPRLTEKETTAAFTRGLLVCSGEIENKATDIIENYYLFSQESNSTQMQDSGDARNRNFFISLRSKTDFNRFILGIKGTANMPSTANKEEDTQEQVTKTMEQLFQMPGPAYPGMYLVQ